MKDVKFDFDKVVVENLNPVRDRYQPKEFVYNEQHGYLQVKKFDEVKQTYVCKVKQQEDGEKITKEQEEVEVKHEELSDTIIVNARILTEEKQVVARLQVNINDIMANLKDYYEIKGGAFTVIYNGEPVKKEDTYLRRLVKSNSSFFLISGSLLALRWKRFGRIVTTDYFYMSDSYWDAVVFKPKIDVYLLGFAILNHYEKHPFKLKFKYVIGTDESQEHEIDLSNDMVEEDNIFYIDFQKIGISPVRVQADTPLHLCAKSTCSNPNRFNYGYEGYNYQTLPNQDFDFTIEYSSFNQNSTSTDFGQFPYILYAK